ncbi:hypothetical protein [Rickettsiales endosymbiont of Stachyamoeba lipophora]|uniref:hypothetical protein n=1 Tax=Rickettsiales endosymbiont of Stachyamoeba lipophora TaxID=2486578 RepID=UPI000F654FF2|nr:hypothetical protein [Rickettsiales endosymbiont of Stachyamoeba lipophora]AZL15136.1 hypothetical protein EF513_00975 [Rickettsiales endosymbiont of Stachyamoeba lipophora]
MPSSSSSSGSSSGSSSSSSLRQSPQTSVQPGNNTSNMERKYSEETLSKVATIFAKIELYAQQEYRKQSFLQSYKEVLISLAKNNGLDDDSSLACLCDIYRAGIREGKGTGNSEAIEQEWLIKALNEARVEVAITDVCNKLSNLTSDRNDIVGVIRNYLKTERHLPEELANKVMQNPVIDNKIANYLLINQPQQIKKTPSSAIHSISKNQAPTAASKPALQSASSSATTAVRPLSEIEQEIKNLSGNLSKIKKQAHDREEIEIDPYEENVSKNIFAQEIRKYLQRKGLNNKEISTVLMHETIKNQLRIYIKEVTQKAVKESKRVDALVKKYREEEGMNPPTSAAEATNGMSETPPAAANSTTETNGMSETPPAAANSTTETILENVAVSENSDSVEVSESPDTDLYSEAGSDTDAEDDLEGQVQTFEKAREVLLDKIANVNCSYAEIDGLFNSTVTIKVGGKSKNVKFFDHLDPAFIFEAQDENTNIYTDLLRNINQNPTCLAILYKLFQEKKPDSKVLCIYYEEDSQHPGQFIEYKYPLLHYAILRQSYEAIKLAMSCDSLVNDPQFVSSEIVKNANGQFISASDSALSYLRQGYEQMIRTNNTIDRFTKTNKDLADKNIEYAKKIVNSVDEFEKNYYQQLIWSIRDNIINANGEEQNTKETLSNIKSYWNLKREEALLVQKIEKIKNSGWYSLLMRIWHLNFDQEALIVDLENRTQKIEDAIEERDKKIKDAIRPDSTNNNSRSLDLITQELESYSRITYPLFFSKIKYKSIYAVLAIVIAGITYAQLMAAGVLVAPTIFLSALASVTSVIVLKKVAEIIEFEILKTSLFKVLFGSPLKSLRTIALGLLSLPLLGVAFMFPIVQLIAACYVIYKCIKFIANVLINSANSIGKRASYLAVSMVTVFSVIGTVVSIKVVGRVILAPLSKRLPGFVTILPRLLAKSPMTLALGVIVGGIVAYYSSKIFANKGYSIVDESKNENLTTQERESIKDQNALNKFKQRELLKSYLISAGGSLGGIAGGILLSMVGCAPATIVFAALLIEWVASHVSLNYNPEQAQSMGYALRQEKIEVPVQPVQENQPQQTRTDIHYSYEYLSGKQSVFGNQKLQYALDSISPLGSFVERFKEADKASISRTDA